MPSRYDPPARLNATAAPAPLLELESSICGVLALPGHRRHRIAGLLQESDPALAEELTRFWGDSLEEWIEIVILLERAGLTLSQDVDAAIDVITELAATQRKAPPMPSEEDEVQRGAQRRLDRLADSDELRQRWSQLLHRLWGRVREDWESGAGAEARRVSEGLQGRIDAGEPLASIISARHFALGDAFRELMDGASPVVISPLTMNTDSKYILQVGDGPVYIGFGTNWEARIEDRTRATELEANAFKVFADRTRLGILRTLMSHSASITDLARQFDVSQPTVSAHVKILREAGILTSARRGPLTLYRADRAEVRKLLETATLGLREHGL